MSGGLALGCIRQQERAGGKQQDPELATRAERGLVTGYRIRVFRVLALHCGAS